MREEQATEVSEKTQAAMVRAGEDILEKVPVQVEVEVSREWRHEVGDYAFCRLPLAYLDPQISPEMATWQRQRPSLPDNLYLM